MVASEGASVIYGIKGTVLDFEIIKNIPLIEYRSKLNIALKNLIEKNIPYDIEFRIKALDTGEIKDIHSTAFYDREKSTLFGIINDITKRKYVENELRESEKRYRELFMINPHPMCVYDEETLSFQMINDAFIAHYGYNRDEFLKMTIKDIIPEQDLTRFEQSIKHVNYGIEKSGIWRHRKKDGTIILMDVTSHTMLFNDRRAEMVLAIDVTERIKAQSALEESELKFRSLIEHSSDAIFLLYKEKFEVINSQFTNLSGYTLEEVQAKAFSFLTIVSPKSRNLIKERFENRKTGKEIPSVYDFTAVSKNGNEIECEASIAYISYKDGTAALGIIRDITSRKKSEEALRESTRNLNATLNATADGILAVDAQKKVLFFNQQFVNLWNIPPSVLNKFDDNVLLNFVLQQLNNPDSFLDNVHKHYESRESGFDTLYFKNGKIFERYSFQLKYENSELSGKVWSFRDVTERKLTEENLRVSERNFRMIFENSPLGIYIALPDGTMVDANQSLLKILDSPSFEETRKINILTFPPLVECGYADKFKECVNEGEIIEVEMPYVSKWGRKTFLSSYFVPLRGMDGKLEKVYTLISDITERKKLEEKIKESELKFRTIADFTYDWEYWSSPDNQLFYISPSCERITGYSSEEFYNNPNLIEDIIYPDDLEIWSKSLNAIYTKSIFKCDVRIQCKDNQLKWINHICLAIYSEDGTYMGRRASNRDITERKQIEDSLLKLKKAVESSGEVIFLTNLEGIYTYINPAFTNLYGFTENELVGKMTPRVLKSGILGHDIYINFWKNLTSGSDVWGELINKRKNGELVNIEGSASPIFDEDNKIIGFLGIQRDITQRKKADEAIRESEEKFRNIFQNHPAVKLLIDPESGSIVDANVSAANYYGWSVNELKHMNLTQINSLSDDEIKTEMGKAKIKQKTIFEFKHRKADGTIRDVEIFSGNVVIGGKNYLHSIIHDITEKKENENLLKENEEKMRLLVEGTSYFFFYTHNITGEVTYVSPSVEKITGYKVEDWLGQNHWFATNSPINSITRERTRKMLKGETLKNPVNLEIYNPSGTPILLEIYEVPLIEEGKIVGLQGIAHDITERNRLIQNIQKLSSAVHQSPVSILITDINGNIEYTNPKFTEVSGYGYNEAIGQNSRILSSGKHPKEFYSNLWETILSGKNWSGIFNNKKKTGELFWESVIISPIKNEDGKIMNFVGVKEDITEKIEKEIELGKYREHLERLVEERTEELDQLNRDLIDQLQKQKELEDQLNIALSKEKDVNELKTRFIATVSHEFRTPLASLLSSSQMIQRYSKRWGEEKLTEHYNRISSTVNYLTNLLDEVLTISRTDREIITNNPEPVEIEDLFNSYFEDIRSILTEKHEVLFINKCDIRKISIDKKLLRQIMVNLLTNSIKYSPDGGKVELIIHNKNGKLFVKVSDQGFGIPEDEIRYIFEPFYRSKNSLGIQGTGLGLNIVKRCCEILRGEISVNSKIKEGTTFNISIPYHEK